MSLVQRFRDQPLLGKIPAGKVLVAVSGGADSTALLRLCAALAPGLGWDLRAGHVQHGLRGRASLGDQRFVEDLCGGLGIACLVRRVRVPKSGGKFSEEAARRLRYRALAEMARSCGARALLTAHTADDQAETVLLNLLRGAGPDGLCGIRPERPLSEITGDARHHSMTVFRPLLSFERSDLLNDLRDMHQPHREDRTNRLLRYRRNWVRAELLPLLEKVQPRIARRLADFAALFQEERALRDGDLRRMTARVLRGKRLDLASFFRYDICLRRQFLHRLFPRRSYREIAGMLAFLGRRKSGRRAGLDALLRDGRKKPSRPSNPIRTELAVPGASRCPEWKLKVTGRLLDRVPPPSVYRRVPARVAYFDADKIGPKARWTIRAWQPGDRFRPIGLGGTQKLQDFFTDRKVTRGRRNRVPLVEAGGRIRWIVGHRTDEDSKIGRGTRKVIELKLEKASGH